MQLALYNDVVVFDQVRLLLCVSVDVPPFQSNHVLPLCVCVYVSAFV